VPLESTVVNQILPLPTAIQLQGQLLKEKDTGSTDQAMISSDEAHTDQHGTPDPTTFGTKINAPDATLLAFEAYALAKRQRRTARNKRQPKPSTACFGFDTPILMESLGIAYWKLIHKPEKGESVVQTLPSGTIEDLTDAHTTPIKTTCCFQCQTGGSDMVRMGSCIITAHHHILTEDGWMTARQAAARTPGDGPQQF